MNSTAFILANTVFIAPPLVPEVRLHLAVAIMPLWRKTEEELQEQGVPPPYWAFAWAGGQALARYILDNPEMVRGKSVLDFGSGSGLVAIAAAKAGARSIMASDIDAYAADAIALNARANGVCVHTTTEDVVGSLNPEDIILCGDVCYEKPLAERLLTWLQTKDAEIFLGDPGRSYFPKSGITRVARYHVKTTRELEDYEIRETGVYRLLPKAKKANTSVKT